MDVQIVLCSHLPLNHQHFLLTSAINCTTSLLQTIYSWKMTTSVIVAILNYNLLLPHTHGHMDYCEPTSKYITRKKASIECAAN